MFAYIITCFLRKLVLLAALVALVSAEKIKIESRVWPKNCHRNHCEPSKESYVSPHECHANSDNGTCSNADPSVCKDDHESCAQWAKRGECLTNTQFMMGSCRKSCGACESQDEDENCLLKDTRYDCPKLVEDLAPLFCNGDAEHLFHQCPQSCGRCIRSSSDFGVEQKIAEWPEDKDSSEAMITQAIIQSSIKYMRDLRNDPEQNHIRMCENQHELCSVWAATGQCKETPVYMKGNCGPACQTCHWVDSEQRCPMDAYRNSKEFDVLKEPGDLNHLFERAVQFPDYVKRYTPKIYSRPGAEEDSVLEGPWVVQFDNFVSDEEIDRLIHYGNHTGYERSLGEGSQNVDGTFKDEMVKERTSLNSWCGEDCKTDPIVSSLIDRIAQLTRAPIPNFEDLQLLKYEPGQFYKQHHDYIDRQFDRPCGVRILTFFLYLNDICEEGDCGGGTAFPELGITVQPKKGSALLWPSVLDEMPNEIDERTEHEAQPVKKGIKYGANAWIHMRDFQEPHLNDCT